MGNIRGWAGPTPLTFRRMQTILQRKIINQQRSFGMKVAIPSFSGYVPVAMKRLFPNVSFVIADPWNNFPNKYCCSLYLNSFEPLFNNISNLFLRNVIRNYGTDHIYFTDPFNEMQPKSANPSYLAMTAKYVFHSIATIDNKAIWLLQGWMFVNNIFWSNNRIKAFVTAVPKGRLLILDMQSEQFPQYERTQSYYGQPFIWCMLHNFGGTLGMHGSTDLVNKGIRTARSMANSSMIGVGIVPEGINQNYVMYALVLERAWLKNDIDLTEWFNTYSDVRYGILNSELREAWQILRNSVYSYYGIKKIHGKYAIARRPSTRLNLWTWYNLSDIYNSWTKVLECNSTIPLNYYNEYKHDLVDITRQFLQTIFEQIYVKLMYSFKSKQNELFEFLAGSLLSIFTDMEEILATNTHFLLGNWLDAAKKWSTNCEEEELYEFNARNQITLWGPNGEIVDYATKQWSGVVKDFFQPRWKLFTEYLGKSLHENVPFNNNIFVNDVYHIIENPFNYHRKKYPTEPNGDTYKISKRIYMKWFKFLTNGTTAEKLSIKLIFYKKNP